MLINLSIFKISWKPILQIYHKLVWGMLLIHKILFKRNLYSESRAANLTEILQASRWKLV